MWIQQLWRQRPNWGEMILMLLDNALIGGCLKLIVSHYKTKTDPIFRIAIHVDHIKSMYFHPGDGLLHSTNLLQKRNLLAVMALLH